MKSSSFALPRKKLYPLKTKKQAISAIAYSKKYARTGKLSRKERDIVLRKAHKKFPSIKIS
jgi:hypothetical protein